MVGCYVCDNWYHIECAGVKKSLFDVLSETSCVHYICNSCQMSSTSLSKNVKNSKIENELQKQGETLKTLSKTIENLVKTSSVADRAGVQRELQSDCSQTAD